MRSTEWVLVCVLGAATPASGLAGPVCQDLDGDDFSSTPGCGVLDCNDADPHVFPGAPEQCNGGDDDCDGITDEDCSGICTSPEKRFGERRIEGSAGASQRMPSMVRIRNGYAVSWNQRVSDTGFECDGEIRLARLDEDGSLRFGPTLVRAPGSPGRAAWDSYLDWSGEEFVVGVGDVPIPDCTTPGLERAFFQRLDASLSPIGDAIDVSCHQGVSVAVGVLWTGAQWVLFWSEGMNVPATLDGDYAARMSP
ncbi:putative metal-binding motif-containing protein, partial [Candidatus Uhrbacteria bacterium]|nr:putative metal-binding motif-containing protein [Candidatus Uhrbacteria bacterium]